MPRWTRPPMSEADFVNTARITPEPQTRHWKCKVPGCTQKKGSVIRPHCPVHKCLMNPKHAG